MSEPSQTGFLITFEGSEGCGKSTRIRPLIETLAAMGRNPLLVREPAGTPIGAELHCHVLFQGIRV